MCVLAHALLSTVFNTCPLLQHSPGLDGAAFSSRMPAGKITQQEMECFPDIAHGSQSAVMEFLFIRNKLLQTWLQDPTNELTIEKAQSVVVLPQSGKCLNCSRGDNLAKCHQAHFRVLRVGLGTRLVLVSDH